MTILYDDVTILYDDVTILYDDVTILYDDVAHDALLSHGSSLSISSSCDTVDSSVDHLLWRVA